MSVASGETPQLITDRAHVVWDWNGTLLDDLSIVVAAVNRSISQLGEGPIDGDIYRDHYTRPVRRFYDALMGRVVNDEEWLRLDTGFHDAYFTMAEEARLTEGAVEAFDHLDAHGVGQSLLSMSPQHWLDQIVDRLGLTKRLQLVDGLSEPTGGLKAPRLAEHLEVLGIDGGDVFVIGDTPDDVAAARHVGATPILFHGGSHHLELLQAEGVPVTETLVEAAEMVTSALAVSRR
ncbi:MAG TPA: HAD family hydrolase [Acidimicrobiia bacterium]|nr:HAD family hydrolase [Acidimicrobiia bacterium]